MRSRAPLFTLLLVVSFLSLPFVAYAGIPFFGPIIPAEFNACAAGWGMLITVVNNIISFLLTLAIVFVAPLMIAYAGFLFVVNPVDSGGISKAKGILTNTIFGIVIALASWMIVDALMVVLYSGSEGSSKWGTWASLVTSGNLPACLPQQGTASQPGVITSAPVGVGGLKAPPAGKAGTACDPAVLKAAVPSLTAAQANTLACIAAPESSCGAPHNPPNYNWNSAVSSPGSSAAGAFQVLLSTNARCYENAACYAAAGVSGPLNCASGFSRGNPKTDSAGAAVVQKCLAAANNLTCSTSAAACLVNQNGGSFSAWQADVNSARQTGCITSG
ncbi:MAG: pilin [bacterium]|nr:pilin [bacterium]